MRRGHVFWEKTEGRMYKTKSKTKETFFNGAVLLKQDKYLNCDFVGFMRLLRNKKEAFLAIASLLNKH
jgi:hypothetical protein